MIYASLALFLISFMIYRYSDVSLMGVPLWSSFFAGLGFPLNFSQAWPMTYAAMA